MDMNRDIDMDRDMDMGMGMGIGMDMDINYCLTAEVAFKRTLTQDILAFFDHLQY
jgi:hypothetical protein